MSGFFSRMNPTLRGFLIIAAVAVAIVVLRLQITLVALLVVARIAFILAIAFFVYLMWRERRGEIAQWPRRAQVGIGLLLLSDHRRAADRLHYLYGTLSLLAVLAPWMYAPAERRGRLAWFTGATLVAGALAVRAYLTAT